jgi:polysaccharide biosynthesis/export protein
MNMRIRLSGAILILLAAAGCASYQPAPPAFHAAINKPYLLDSGDRVRVTVFEQTSLTNTYSVDQAGYVAFPLVGSVVARGRTAQQLEGDLAAKLQNGFLRNPDVSVDIDRYRPIFVPGMTVQKAVAVAGGFSVRALQGNVDITRAINGKVMTGRVLITDPLLPGDTIYVRERLF